MELAIVFIVMLSNGDLWFGSTLLAAGAWVTCGAVIGAWVTCVAVIGDAEPHFFPKGEKL
jgi:hypothetical protein